LTVHTKGQRAWYHLLCASPADVGTYDVFLNFVDPVFRTPEKQADYLSFKRSDANVPLQLFLFLASAVYVGTRFAFNNDEYPYNPTALLAILAAAFAAFCVAATAFLRTAAVSYSYHLSFLQSYQASASAFLASRYGRVLDDGVVVGSALSTGLYLVSRALSGPCPPDTPVFRSQACDPDVDAHSLPPEDVFLAVTAVLVAQSIARGSSKAAVCLGWAITAACVNASLAVVRSSDYLWVNLEVAAMVCLSYEVERLPLRQFIKSVRVIESSEANGRLRVQLAAYEAREATQALDAKRSLVRHIAHEVKTHQYFGRR
jgi:hypothetical protein